MFIFIDTETTSTTDKDKLCQLAYKTGQGTIVNELFNPGINISEEAMNVHKITNQMVEDKIPFQKSKTRSDLIELLNNPDNILIAHNALFDVGMLKKEEVFPPQYICTLKLIRFLDPDNIIPEYNLQFLRTYYDINIDAVAHDALGDILVLEEVFYRGVFKKFQEKFGDNAIGRMIEISTKPFLLKLMPFGKHKGNKFEQIPESYLRWLVGVDIDEDLQYTVSYHLKTLAIEN